MHWTLRVQMFVPFCDVWNIQQARSLKKKKHKNLLSGNLSCVTSSGKLICNVYQRFKIIYFLMQGSLFPTDRWPGASKTTSRASGFEQIFSSLFHISRSKNFKILEVGQVMILRKGKPCYGSLEPMGHDPYGSQSTGNGSHHWCLY